MVWMRAWGNFVFVEQGQVDHFGNKDRGLVLKGDNGNGNQDPAGERSAGRGK